MSRYTNADMLKKQVESSYTEYPIMIQIRKALKDFIDEAPTIDVEPKRGEWIDMGDFEQCSACKGTRLKEFQSYYGKTTWIKTPYCPHCGAKMKGANDEN